MNHVTKKLKEDLSRSVQQVKTRVVKYPVVIPVVVVIAMLPYVASRIFKATIVRRQTCEIEDSVQEVDIIEFLAITDSLQTQAVEDVLACFARDAWLPISRRRCTADFRHNGYAAPVLCELLDNNFQPFVNLGF